MTATTETAPSLICVITPLTADGSLATIPPKIIIEIPFPMPYSLICSPSHIRNAVPAVRTMMMVIMLKALLSTIALLNRPIVRPTAWISPSTTVMYLVIAAIFLRPSAPSLARRSKYGNAIVSS